MTLSKGFTNELKSTNAAAVIGIKVGDALDTLITDLNTQFDYPLRLYASATPDAFLNISASTTTTSDGATKVSSPINGVGPATFATGKINMGTGVLTGLGTITLNGGTFATTFSGLTKTDTKYRRFVFCQQQDGSVAVVSSSESTTQAALTDYGQLAAQAGGTYKGHVDVIWVNASTQYKTPSAVGNTIGDDGIFRPDGSGGGGGVATPLALQSASTPNVTMSSGVLPLTDGRELAAWDGGGAATTNFAATLSFSATAVLAASPSTIGGGGSPANSTLYYLYIDIDSLPATPTTLTSGTQTGRLLYPVTSSNFVLGTTDKFSLNRSRYAYRGQLYTTSAGAWSGSGAELTPAATTQGNTGPTATSLIASRPATGSVVGAPGSSGQIAQGHILSVKSFPSGIATANRVWYPLSSVNDGSTNGINLTNTGTVTFGAADLFGGTTAAAFSGANRLSSTNALFNPSTGAWAAAIWVKPTGVSGQQAIVGTGRVSGGSTVNWFILMTNADLSIYDSTGLVILTVSGVFTAGKLIHIGARYDGSGTVSAYVNGKLTGAAPFSAATVSSPEMDIGASNLGGVPGFFFTGSMSQFTFINSAVTAADMNRLASYRYDHNAAVTPSNQRWSVKSYPVGGEPATRPTGAIISEGDANSVFWDFSDMGSTDTVDVILEDLGLSPFVAPPVAPFDVIYTAAFPTSVAHGQPDVPEVIMQYEDGTAGEWTAPIDLEGKVRVDATNIYFDGPFSATPAASPNRAWVTARSKRLATVGVPQAQPSRLGTVTSFKPIIKSSVSALSAGYTVLDSDGFETFLITTGSSTITMVLPAAANNAGRTLVFKKVDAGSGKITINRAGSDSINGYTTTDIGTGAGNQYACISMISDGTNWHVMAVAGEYIENNRSSSINVASAGSGAIFSVDSGNATVNDGNETGVPLAPGVWDIQAVFYLIDVSLTALTDIGVFIGTAKGNAATGRVLSKNYVAMNFTTNPTANHDIVLASPIWRVNITTATPYYAKGQLSYGTATTANAQGVIRAARLL